METRPFSTDPEGRACAVCGRVLEQEGGRFQHSLADLLEINDHPAVPVPYSEIPEQLRPRCDFCFADEPSWTLTTVPTSMLSVNVKWDGWWAVCKDCASFIEADNWRGLRVKVFAIFEAKYGGLHSDLKDEMRVLFHTLRTNMTSFTRDMA